MPLYGYKCGRCGKTKDVFAPMSHLPPECCNAVMGREFGVPLVKIGPALWIERMEDIGKAQSDRGERRRFVHPREVQAT